MQATNGAWKTTRNRSIVKTAFRANTTTRLANGRCYESVNSSLLLGRIDVSVVGQEDIAVRRYTSTQKRRIDKQISTTPIVSEDVSTVELKNKTKRWIDIPLGTWTSREISLGRFLIDAWLRNLESSSKDRARWSTMILRRWIRERITKGSDSSSSSSSSSISDIILSTSSEIIEMLHRVLHAWRLVEDDKIHASNEALDILYYVQNSFESTKDETLRPGDKAYTMALYALANLASEDPSTCCHEAESLLELSLQQTTHTPDIRLLNACLQVFSKCSPYQHDAPERAEALLESMSTIVKPDASSFSSVLHAWAGSKRVGSAERSQAILDHMITTNYLDVDSLCFNVCIDAWAKSGSADKAETLLWRMNQLHEEGHPTVHPDIVSFNSTLDAWAKSKHTEAGKKTEDLLSKMPKTISPTEETFTIVLDAWSRTRDSGQKVQDMLYRMEEMYASGEGKIRPTKRSYLCAIRAWSNTNVEEAPEHVEALTEQMKMLSSMGGDRSDLAPCVIVYSAVIDAWSKSRRQDAPEKAYKLLRDMQSLTRSGKKNLLPNTITYNSVLSAYARKGRSTDAESLLEEMKAMSLEGIVEPDSITYSIVIHAHAKSLADDAAEQATRLLEEMSDSFQRGNDLVRPTIHTYTSTISAWSNSKRNDSASQAQSLFWEALKLYKLGNKDLKPTVVTMNSVLRAWSLSDEGGAAERAEAFFRSVEDETSLEIKPDNTTFLHLISVWARSGRRNATKKAKMFLQLLKDRSANAKSTDLCLSTAHFNLVILALSKSGDSNAVSQVESLINEMLSLSDSGLDVKPNVTTYNYLLKAVAKSDIPDKKQRVTNIMKQMQNHQVKPDSVTMQMNRSYYSSPESELKDKQ